MTLDQEPRLETPARSRQRDNSFSQKRGGCLRAERFPWCAFKKSWMNCEENSSLLILRRIGRSHSGVFGTNPAGAFISAGDSC